MQMLFQSEMSPQDAKKLEAKFWKSAKAADTTREFANALFEGAAKEIAGLDEVIAKHAGVAGKLHFFSSLTIFTISVADFSISSTMSLTRLTR